MTAEGRWNERRLVLFTEYEDTRRWLEVQLAEALDDLAPDDRIASFTGATPTERREELKRRFNSDPAEDPLRILICTDAAREGINLQMRCHDLIHIDLPWNPARLEQRNGRIDRKLQPSPEVWCRYFVYEQRPEDVVLQALVRKTERIREQLGSAGQVIGQRLSDRLDREGIWRPETQAREIDEASDERLEKTAVAEMDDETAARRARQAKELDELRALREESRERVGVDPEMLREGRRRGDGARRRLARSRAGRRDRRRRAVPPRSRRSGFRRPAAGPEALDDLRIRRRKRSERLKDWRAEAPLRAVSFRPALTADGVDVEGVLQLHLEHRLVRRLLSRFLSQGFVSGLSRASIVIGPGAQPRVVLLGRLALYGPGAARLHEEILLVTAAWTESDRPGPLKPFGAVREAATLEQLDHAFREPRAPAQSIIDRIRPWAARDAADLEPELQRRAEARKADAIRDLSAVGDAEAKAIRRLLEDQRARVAKADAEPEDPQLTPVRRRRGRAASAGPAPLEGEARKADEGHRRRAGPRSGGLRRRRRPAGDDRPRLSLAGGQLIMAGIDPNDEWLGYVQPVGLVVAPVVLARYGLTPAIQTRADTEAVACVRLAEARRRQSEGRRSRAPRRPLGLLRRHPRLAARRRSPARPAGRRCRRTCSSRSRRATPRSRRIGRSPTRTAAGSCWSRIEPPGRESR